MISAAPSAHRSPSSLKVKRTQSHQPMGKAKDGGRRVCWRRLLLLPRRRFQVLPLKRRPVRIPVLTANTLARADVCSAAPTRSPVDNCAPLIPHPTQKHSERRNLAVSLRFTRIIWESACRSLAPENFSRVVPKLEVALAASKKLRNTGKLRRRGFFAKLGLAGLAFNHSSRLLMNCR